MQDKPKKEKPSKRQIAQMIRNDEVVLPIIYAKVDEARPRVFLGATLQKLREQNKISTYDMVQKGFRMENIQKIETGLENYTISTLLDYLNLIGIDLKKLLDSQVIAPARN